MGLMKMFKMNQLAYEELLKFLYHCEDKGIDEFSVKESRNLPSIFRVECEELGFSNPNDGIVPVHATIRKLKDTLSKYPYNQKG